MTTLLYLTDSYLQTFDAKVTQVEADSRGIVLDRSAFYPGGGGQPCDYGSMTIGTTSYPVERVKKRGDDSVHFLGGSEPIPSPGAAIHGQIAWERRYKLMRTHSAMHVLCGVIFCDYGALVTGCDFEPLSGHMDFEFETLGAELVKAIEETVNQEIKSGREVKIRTLPRLEAFKIPDLIRTKINLLPENITQVRTVEIVGLDLQADGGTHVRNTAEIGHLRVVDYKSKGAINKRIYISVE
jgi:misacylated tRNA(Ala) deacylase